MVIAGIPTFMGTFESVDPSPGVPENPKIFDTATAVITIAESDGVSPAGRNPTSSGDTDTGPRLFQRRFSSSTASWTAALNFLSGFRASPYPKNAYPPPSSLEGDRVDRSSPAHTSHVEGRLRLAGDFEVIYFRDRPAHGLDGIAMPKAPKLWPPGPLKVAR